MIASKTLQDSDTVLASLVNLRNELLDRRTLYLPTDEVIMKINSCLYSKYPPEYKK